MTEEKRAGLNSLLNQMTVPAVSDSGFQTKQGLTTPVTDNVRDLQDAHKYTNLQNQTLNNSVGLRGSSYGGLSNTGLSNLNMPAWIDTSYSQVPVELYNASTGETVKKYNNLLDYQRDTMIVTGGADQIPSFDFADTVVPIATSATVRGIQLSKIPVVGTATGALLGAAEGALKVTEALAEAQDAFWKDSERTVSLLAEEDTDADGNTIYKVNTNKAAAGNALSGGLVKSYQSVPTDTPATWNEAGTGLNIALAPSFANSDTYKEYIEDVAQSLKGLTKDTDTDGTYIDTLNTALKQMQDRYLLDQQEAATLKAKFPGASEEAITQAIDNEVCGYTTSEDDLEAPMYIFNESGELTQSTAKAVFDKLYDMGDDKVAKDKYLVQLQGYINDEKTSDADRAILYGQLKAIYAVNQNSKLKYKGMIEKGFWDHIGENPLLAGVSTNQVASMVSFGQSYGELKMFTESQVTKTLAALASAAINLKTTASAMNLIEGANRKVFTGVGDALSKVSSESLASFGKWLSANSQQPAAFADITVSTYGDLGAKLLGAGFDFGLQAVSDLEFDLAKLGISNLTGKEMDFWDEFSSDLALDMFFTYMNSGALTDAFKSAGITDYSTADLARVIRDNGTVTINEDTKIKTLKFNVEGRGEYTVKIDGDELSTTTTTGKGKNNTTTASSPDSEVRGLTIEELNTALSKAYFAVNYESQQRAAQLLVRLADKHPILYKGYRAVIDNAIDLKMLGYRKLAETGDYTDLIKLSNASNSNRAYNAAYTRFSRSGGQEALMGLNKASNDFTAATGRKTLSDDDSTYLNAKQGWLRAQQDYKKNSKEYENSKKFYEDSLVKISESDRLALDQLHTALAAFAKKIGAFEAKEGLQTSNFFENIQKYKEYVPMFVKPSGEAKSVEYRRAHRQTVNEDVKIHPSAMQNPVESTMQYMESVVRNAARAAQVKTVLDVVRQIPGVTVSNDSTFRQDYESLPLETLVTKYNIPKEARQAMQKLADTEASYQKQITSIMEKNYVSKQFEDYERAQAILAAGVSNNLLTPDEVRGLPATERDTLAKKYGLLPSDQYDTVNTTFANVPEPAPGMTRLYRGLTQPYSEKDTSKNTIESWASEWSTSHAYAGPDGIVYYIDVPTRVLLEEPDGVEHWGSIESQSGDGQEYRLSFEAREKLGTKPQVYAQNNQSAKIAAAHNATRPLKSDGTPYLSKDVGPYKKGMTAEDMKSVFLNGLRDSLEGALKDAKRRNFKFRKYFQAYGDAQLDSTMARIYENFDSLTQADITSIITKEVMKATPMVSYDQMIYHWIDNNSIKRQEELLNDPEILSGEAGFDVKNTRKVKTADASVRVYTEGRVDTIYLNGSTKEARETLKGVTDVLNAPLAQPYKNGILRMLNAALQTTAQLKRFNRSGGLPSRAPVNLTRDTQQAFRQAGIDAILDPAKLFGSLIDPELYTEDQLKGIYADLDRIKQEAAGYTEAEVAKLYRRGAVGAASNLAGRPEAPSFEQSVTLRPGNRTLNQLKYQFSLLGYNLKNFGRGGIADILMTPGNIAEAATRNRVGQNAYLFELNNRMRGGATLEEAMSSAYEKGAWEARNATTDFSTKGTLTNWMARFTPFSYASFSDVASKVESFVMDPLGISSRTAVSMMAYMMNLATLLSNEENRKRYMNMTEYQRTNSMMVDLGDGMLLTIPIDDAYAGLLSPIRTFVETLAFKEPVTFWKVMGTILDVGPLDLSGFTEGDTFNIQRGLEVLTSNYAPALLSFGLEQATGRDFYYDTDLAVDGRYLASYGLSADSAGDYTKSSEDNTILHWVSDFFNIPQWRVQHAFELFTGSIGSYALHYIDKLKGATENESYGKGVAQAFYKSFLPTESGASTAFYNGLDALKKEKQKLMGKLSANWEEQLKTTGTARAELQSKRQKMLDEFALKVTDFISGYLNVYEQTGGLSKSEASSIYYLFDFTDDYQGGGFNVGSAGSQAYEEVHDQAELQASVLAANTIGTAYNPRGTLYQKSDGTWERESPSGVQALNRLMYNRNKEYAAQINRLGEDYNLAKGKSAASAQVSAIYDKATAEGRKPTNEEYAQMDAIRAKWDIEAALALAPFFEANGLDMINSSAVAEELGKYFLVIGDAEKDNKGRYISASGLNKQRGFVQSFVKSIYEKAGIK